MRYVEESNSKIESKIVVVRDWQRSGGKEGMFNGYRVSVFRDE